MLLRFFDLSQFLHLNYYKHCIHILININEAESVISEKTNSPSTMRDASIKVLDISVTPIFMVDEALKKNQLVKILTVAIPTPISISAVYPVHRFLLPPPK